jgi:hypothetical protein
VFGRGTAPRDFSLSDQRIRPVACMTINNVTIEMIVIANPVNPFQKNAYEKSTR